MTGAPVTRRLPKAAGLCALVAAVTCAAYAPVWRAGFVWDDPGYVTRPGLRSLGGLWRIWFQVGATEQYYPLLHSFFWIQHLLWGGAPLGYHLVGVALHATAACLFALVLLRLRMGRAGGAASDATPWLAALLFAVHPVGAESVAWISEQKNTLSLVFYLLAALKFLEFRDGGGWRAYAPASALFACALLSKTVTATLPGALLVALWWRRGRLDLRRDVVPLMPWFVAGAGAGLGSAWVERVYVGAGGSHFALTWGQRLLLAGRIPWFYLGKLVWPARLVFIYPRWDLERGDAPGAFGLLASVAALAALWAWRRRGRGPLAAALFFLGSLFPTLGFFNVYAFLYSYVADHWDYIPSLGIFAAAAAALTWASRRLPGPARRGGAALLLAVLAAITWRQCLAYRDPETFYATIVRRNPGAWMAQSNLGDLLAAQGRLDAALAHYRAALRDRDDLEQTHYNLAVALARAGRLSDAAAEYRAALRFDPQFLAAHTGLGTVLYRLGRLREASAQFEAALAINAHDRPARAQADWMAAEDYRAAVGAFGARRWADAADLFRLAIELHPDFPEAENGLGAALAAAGHAAQAAAHYKTALRLRPGYPEAERNLAAALRSLGRAQP